jgi:hypothetical protein
VSLRVGKDLQWHQQGIIEEIFKKENGYQAFHFPGLLIITDLALYLKVPRIFGLLV